MYIYVSREKDTERRERLTGGPKSWTYRVVKFQSLKFSPGEFVDGKETKETELFTKVVGGSLRGEEGVGVVQ